MKKTSFLAVVGGKLIMLDTDLAELFKYRDIIQRMSSDAKLIPLKEILQGISPKTVFF